MLGWGFMSWPFLFLALFTNVVEGVFSEVWHSPGQTL
jgi:hypothetical protein